MTADAFCELLDYADQELEALVQKNALLKYLQAGICLLQPPKPLLLIRESLITDCLISIRRLDDRDKRAKASLRNLLFPLLPCSLDQALLAELKANYSRSADLTSFDGRHLSAIQAWKTFVGEREAIRSVTDKWIAHFELEKEQSVPIAFYSPFRADPLPDVIVQIDKCVGFAVAIVDELMKLTRAQSVDVHASVPAAQSTAARFWKPFSKCLAFTPLINKGDEEPLFFGPQKSAARRNEASATYRDSSQRPSFTVTSRFAVAVATISVD